MEPLPFYALVRTCGPRTHQNPDRPLGVGVIVGSWKRFSSDAVEPEANWLAPL